MSIELAIQLPDSVCNLVTPSAFESFTLSGPGIEHQSQLQSLTADDLFPEGFTNSDLAECCRSGLWLLHNFLNQSHDISQEIHSPEGSYWHGIMHRLEGDFWNSKYWYRKVGNHPVYETIANECGSSKWDPNDYVDQCELASESGSDVARKSVQAIAAIEWKSLFEFCYQHAV
ncbi:MAG: hypothetical protein AB8B55_10820 [Mariniblastus sp.]